MSRTFVTARLYWINEAEGEGHYVDGGESIEIVTAPIDFATAEAHVQLGGEAAVFDPKQNGAIEVFDSGWGPLFSGLWEGCTFHVLVRRIESD
jgi:hypothetical protein